MIKKKDDEDQGSSGCLEIPWAAEPPRTSNGPARVYKSGVEEGQDWLLEEGGWIVHGCILNRRFSREWGMEYLLRGRKLLGL